MESPKNLLVFSDTEIPAEDSREFLLRVARAYPGIEVCSLRPPFTYQALADVLRGRAGYPPLCVRAFRFGTLGGVYLYNDPGVASTGDTCLGFQESMAALERFGSGGSYNEQ